MITAMGFNNFGYLVGDLTDAEMEPIKKEIAKIQDNFLVATPFNKGLAGNVEKEFTLSECKGHVANILSEFIVGYDKTFNYFRQSELSYTSGNFVLEEFWANFQKKYEFNPPHAHNGVYSFIIYVDIPYDIEEEKNNISSRSSNNNVPAHFQFLTINTLGKIVMTNLPVDKTWNNKILFFPACMTHSVQPFYTSDKYRISVSGNLFFRM